MLDSSKINIDHSKIKHEKIIEICKELNGNIYVNPTGGKDLYNTKDFLTSNIKLYFLESFKINYNQFNQKFIPSLSIIDVLMFNGKDRVKELLYNFKLV